VLPHLLRRALARPAKRIPRPILAQQVVATGSQKSSDALPRNKRFAPVGISKVDVNEDRRWRTAWVELHWRTASVQQRDAKCSAVSEAIPRECQIEIVPVGKLGTVDRHSRLLARGHEVNETLLHSINEIHAIVAVTIRGNIDAICDVQAEATREISNVKIKATTLNGGMAKVRNHTCPFELFEASANQMPRIRDHTTANIATCTRVTTGLPCPTDAARMPSIACSVSALTHARVVACGFSAVSALAYGSTAAPRERHSNVACTAVARGNHRRE
jgi:hypothetical protein